VTECNRESLTFSSLSRRKISAYFDGGRLTSDAGGLLLREVDRRIGLIAALAGCIAFTALRWATKTSTITTRSAAIR
jgi:hypothetical protein